MSNTSPPGFALVSSASPGIDYVCRRCCYGRLLPGVHLVNIPHEVS
jgi:hypothetical protein